MSRNMLRDITEAHVACPRCAKTPALMFAFCGRAGDGSLTTANTLAGIGKYQEICPHGQRGVESNIKTEPTELWLRLASVPVLCTSGQLDVLVAFDQSAIQDEEGEGRTLPITQLCDRGILIYDSSPRLMYPNMGHELKIDFAASLLHEKKLLAFGVPMAQEIMKQSGANAYVTRNAAAIGVIAELFSIPDAVCRAQLLREHKGGTRLAWNTAAYEFGRTYATEQRWNTQQTAFPKPAGVKEEDQFTLGGNAIALGALSAGCRYYAGYPITPASEVLEYMAENMPSNGHVAVFLRPDASAEEKEIAMRLCDTFGVTIQEMSELMAINQLNGAAIAGLCKKVCLPAELARCLWRWFFLKGAVPAPACLREPVRKIYCTLCWALTVSFPESLFRQKILRKHFCLALKYSTLPSGTKRP